MNIKKMHQAMNKRISAFLKRRPHRSFRLSRRRDYNRSLKLPGYFAFTKYVWQTLWKNRKTFILLTLFYAILTVLMVGVASQDTYTTLKDTLDSTGVTLFNGGLGGFGKASLLFLSAMTGGLSQSLTDVQQVYAGLILLLTWLTGIWLLRNIMAGNKVKLRDGLYNSGSPLLSTFIVFMVFIVQLLPIALAIIGYSAASISGFLENGAASMLFWIIVGLLSTMSLYWVTSTFFALIIVTLPGMYPLKAIKTAGDLVVGRRLRILMRILWMALTTVIMWGVIMIPVIMLDAWLKGIWSAISWVPTVPVLLLGLTSVTVVWISSYIYLLYRKVVDDDADPA